MPERLCEIEGCASYIGQDSLPCPPRTVLKRIRCAASLSRKCTIGETEMTDWHVCPGCRRERRLSGDGAICDHNVYVPPDWSEAIGSMQPCPGSGLIPVEAT